MATYDDELGVWWRVFHGYSSPDSARTFDVGVEESMGGLDRRV